MVKLRAILHNPFDYLKKTKAEINRISKYTNPVLHPFRRAKEYIRALNAAKLDKVFAKPFLFALNSSTDSVKSLSKNPKLLTEISAGGFDGQILVYDIAEKEIEFNIKSPYSILKSVCFSGDGKNILACGDLHSISIYSKSSLIYQRSYANISPFFSHSYSPIKTLYSTGNIEHISFSYSSNIFSSSGSKLEIWDIEKNFPSLQFNKNQDEYISSCFNKTEENILVACDNGRGVTLFDLRTQNPLSHLTLPNKSTCCSFNPQEPLNFTVGNDDSNLYSFDIRKMDEAKLIHKGHILSVLSLDFSPTGREFVSGSFDRTLRIFPYDSCYSRDCYHNKRMQKVYSVLYTDDDKYIISGSDDGNVRVWKSVGNEKLGVLNKRQEDSLNYGKKLVEKFKYVPEIKKIKNQTRLPKYIKNKEKEKKMKNEKKIKKIKNMEMNGKIEEIEYTPERRKKILESGIVIK